MNQRFFLRIILVLTMIISVAGIQAQSKLFLVFLKTNPDREELSEDKVATLQKGHLENIQRLYDDGNLLLAGPFNGGGGIFVIKAEEPADVDKLLATDPAISAKRFILERYPVRINKGMICEQNEPYEMIQFNFAQFTPVDGQAETDWSAKELYDDTALVVFSVYLNDGRFVEILSSEGDSESYVNNHPLVLSGQYSCQIRPWWSTNKTFCTDIEKKLNY